MASEKKIVKKLQCIFAPLLIIACFQKKFRTILITLNVTLLIPFKTIPKGTSNPGHFKKSDKLFLSWSHLKITLGKFYRPLTPIYLSVMPKTLFTWNLNRIATQVLGLGSIS